MSTKELPFRVTRTWKPQGLTDPKFVCMCAFVFEPDRLVPTRITSSYKDEDGNWHDRKTPDVEIDGAARITVNSAMVKLSAKGDHYVRVMCGLDLPWETSKAIAREAAELQKQYDASRNGTATQTASPTASGSSTGRKNTRPSTTAAPA